MFDPMEIHMTMLGFAGRAHVALPSVRAIAVPLALDGAGLAPEPMRTRKDIAMDWTIDATHTHFGFAVKHMMVSTVRGQFKRYTGKVRLDPRDFTRSSIEGAVEVASIDTGVPERDAHLRTGDFFDVAAHPTITFKSTGVEHEEGSRYRVLGDLTIRGVTKTVTFEVDYSGTARNPWGKTIVGISAAATVHRKEFGVSFDAPLESGGVLVGDKVRIEIECELVLTEDAVGTARASA